MPLVQNPATKEIRVTDDPTGFLEQGWRVPTPEEAQQAARTLQYGSTGQQALAQGERVVRGATLGLVEGFGSDEDIRAREEVSREESPVTSFAADVLPDVALTAATGGLGGAVGLGRAGVLAAESVAAGAVGAGQQAFAEGRHAWEDLGRDAENALIWGGLNFGLGSFHLAKGARSAAGETAEAGAERLDDVAREAEARHIASVEPAVPAAAQDLPGTAPLDATQPLPPRTGPVPLETQLDQGLAAQGGGVGLREAAGVAALGGAAVLGANDEDGGALGAAAAGMGLLLPRALMKKGSPAFRSFVKNIVEPLGEAGLKHADAIPYIERKLASSPLKDEEKSAIVNAIKKSAGKEAPPPAMFSTEALAGESGEFKKMAAAVMGIPDHQLDMNMLVKIEKRIADTGMTDAERDRFFGHVMAHFDRAPTGSTGAAVDYLQTQTGPALGQTRGGFFRGSDGKERYVKFLHGAAAQNEHAANQMYEDFGVMGAKSEIIKTRIPGQSGMQDAVATERLGPDWKPIGNIPEQSPELAREYIRGIPADIVSGNWDIMNNSGNLMSDGKHVLRIDAGEAGAGSGLRMGNVKDEWDEMRRAVLIGNADAKSGIPSRRAVIPAGLISNVLRPENMSAIKTELAQGLSKVELAVAKAGGEKPYVAMRFPHLPAAKRTQLASKIATRIKFVRENIDKIAGVLLMGAGAAAGGEGDGAEGAAVGAGAGGLLSLLLGRRGLSLGKGAFRQAERAAVEDGLERGLRKASQAEADDIVERAVRGAEPVRESDGFGRQRRLYQNRQPIMDVAVKEMQQELTKVVRDVKSAAGPEKLISIAKNVSDNLGAQRQVANEIADSAATFAGEMRGEARAYAAASGKKGMQFQVPGSKALVGALMDHAKQVQEATTGKAMFEALDGFKRVADDIKLGLEKGAQNSVDPLGHQTLIPKVQEFAGKIRTALESADTWGKAGEMQGAYNAVLHDKLLPSMRVFEDAVLQRTHKGYDSVWQTEGWENKIKGLLNDSDPGKRRHVSAVLDAMSELASVRGKYGDAKAAKGITDGVDKIRRTMGLADELHDATERMQAVGDIAGMVPGAPKQWLMGDLASNFRKLTGATDAAVGRSVDDWIRSSRVRGGGLMSKLPRLPEASAEIKALASVAKRRGVSQGMALFMGEDENPTSAFQKRRDALMSDEKFFALLGEDYKSLQEQAPEAYMAVSARAAAARQLLVARMPANVSVSMTRPQGYPPNREAVEDWAVYWNAVQDPMRVIRNIAGVRVQELEVLKTVYPRLYEQVQQNVIERVGEAQASGEPLDDTLLMRLDLLFGMNGTASPAFSQKAAQLARDYTAQQAEAQQAGGGGSAPDSSEPPGPVQGIAQTGATFGQGF
jgi:hypothetical protein